MQENKLRKDIEDKEALFQQLFSQYQKNLKKFPNYIKYDSFKDLKIIFGLYSEIFHLRGFNYSKFSNDKLLKIISPYNLEQRRELIGHLVKELVKNGNEEEAKNVIGLLSKIEISLYWGDLKKMKKPFRSFLKLVHKVASYNIFALLCFIFIFLSLSTIIFCEAQFDCFEILEVKKIKICEANWLNNLGNLFTFIFDLDDKMEVKPLNFVGLLVLIFQKSFLILVIGNYLMKEILNKIKLQ